ncbi:hypothetical protein OE88DRAFT_1803882 [Heliocybe sulcata]|uniref:Uncharacterized protein n=1 Tax=Heliocybe sulcata TaxID=5364 RepID=A0A5C3NKC2_9AGAM|nr:hypothetical protein OE88DRAFT_1803882 [Heliocybe sulcata]
MASWRGPLGIPTADIEERKPNVAILDLQHDVDRLRRLVAMREEKEKQHLGEIAALNASLLQEKLRARRIEALHENGPPPCVHCDGDFLKFARSFFPESFLWRLPGPLIGVPMVRGKPATKPVSNTTSLHLTRRQQKAATDMYFQLKSSLIKWANDDRTHAIAFAPSRHGYGQGPKLKWKTTGFSDRYQYGHYDLFYMDQTQWFYTGVYQVLDMRTILYDQVKAQDPDIAGAIVHDTAPSEGDVLDMVARFYTYGILKVDCIALRRTDFQLPLYVSLTTPRDNVEEKENTRPEDHRTLADATARCGTKRKPEGLNAGETMKMSETGKKAKVVPLQAHVPLGITPVVDEFTTASVSTSQRVGTLPLIAPPTAPSFRFRTFGAAI